MPIEIMLVARAAETVMWADDIANNTQIAKKGIHAAKTIA